MPRIELTGNELAVRLAAWEKLLALRGDVRVPLAQVRGATEDSGFGGPSGISLGLRMPGTHIPYLIAAGTFRKDGDVQFVCIRRKLQTVVIELADNGLTRLVVGVPDAQAAAARINAAVARLQGVA